ncbi:MAG: TIR domain-containing protein, partial [Acidobacteria bacterium]|nr:TIR domain-containing protein [Acidobacteriota bacterium]
MPDANLSTENQFLHDAFISYSRNDSVFVAVLEAALRRYKPPKDLLAPQRRLNVFRDTEDFTGTEYNASVEQHLKASKKLIVVCSPSARHSDYVNDEIRHFAQTHVVADIIPVLIAGIPNNEAKSDADAEMAFPEALVEHLKMPLACDYRGFDPKSDKHASGKEFQQEWFKLLANIYGCTRAEIEQRERRRQHQQRIRWTTAGVSVTSLLALAFGVAEFQRRTAKAEAVAAQSMQQADKDPEQALKLALAAIEQRETELSTSALRLALARAPDLLIPLKARPRKNEDDYVDPAKFELASDGRRIAITDEEPRIVDLQTGRTILEIEGAGRVIKDIRFSPDGAWLATIDDKHNTVIIDAASGKAGVKLDGELYWRESTKDHAQRAAVLFDKMVQTGELDRSGLWRPIRKLT